MYKLVLVRHGESTWNLENRFTGWTDVPLTATGVSQAREAGCLLREAGFTVGAMQGIAFTPSRGLHLSDDMSLNYILSATRDV